MEREQRIRERAHQIWEEEGRPLGRDAEHWERASRQIEEELRYAVHSKRAGTNEVPAANMTEHHGPSSASPTPGLEKADGLSTPGVPPTRPKR